MILKSATSWYVRRGNRPVTSCTFPRSLGLALEFLGSIRPDVCDWRCKHSGTVRRTLYIAAVR